MSSEVLNCPYVFSRGLKKGLPCGVRLKPDRPYCHKHIKIMTKPAPAPPTSPSPKSPNDDSVEEIDLPQDEQVNELSQEENIRLNSPPPEYEDEEDVIAEKKIDLYYKGIPRLHKEVPLEDRGGANPKEWLARIENHLSKDGIDNYFGLCFNITTKAIEKLGCSLGMKINGFSDTLCSLERTKDLITMLKIKHRDLLPEISPEGELIGMAIMTLLTLNKLNQQVESKEQSKQPKQPEQTNTADINSFYEMNAPKITK